MKELTCKDCKRFNSQTGACRYMGSTVLPQRNICPQFKAPDGSRPRFCRLASSIDEMADTISELLITATSEQMKNDGFKPVVTAAKKQTYRVEVKQWLMEVENEQQ